MPDGSFGEKSAAAECLHLEELAHVNGPFGALNSFSEPLDRPTAERCRKRKLLSLVCNG
jgi:hypothetical protein